MFTLERDERACWVVIVSCRSVVNILLSCRHRCVRSHLKSKQSCHWLLLLNSYYHLILSSVQYERFLTGKCLSTSRGIQPQCQQAHPHKQRSIFLSFGTQRIDPSIYSVTITYSTSNATKSQTFSIILLNTLVTERDTWVFKICVNTRFNSVH